MLHKDAFRILTVDFSQKHRDKIITSVSYLICNLVIYFISAKRVSTLHLFINFKLNKFKTIALMHLYWHDEVINKLNAMR